MSISLLVVCSCSRLTVAQSDTVSRVITTKFPAHQGKLRKVYRDSKPHQRPGGAYPRWPAAASMDFVRQRFSTWSSSRRPSVLAVIMCVALYFPFPDCVSNVSVVAGGCGFDRVLRLLEWRVVMVQLRLLPDLGTIRVEILGLNFDLGAGQHVRLCVLSFGTGSRT